MRAVPAPPSTPSRLPVVAAIFIAAGLLVLLALGAGISFGLSTVVWSTGVVLLVLFYVLRTFGWRDIADPIIFYPALIWLVFGFVALLPKDVSPGSIVNLYGEDDLIKSYVLVLLGLVVFMVTYALLASPTGQIVMSKEAFVRVNRTRLVTVVVFVTATRLALLAIGRFGYIQSNESYEATLSFAGLFNIFADLSPFLLVTVAVVAFGRGSQRSDIVLLVVMLIVEFGLGFISGMKAGLTLPVTAVTLGYIYARGRLPWKVLVIGFLIFLFLVPGIEHYRALLSGGGARIDTVPEALSAGGVAARETVDEPQVSERVEKGFRLLVGRLDELSAFTVIRDKTPEQVPFEYGRYYWGAPAYTIIPRIIWPSKPEIGSIGGQTALDYYGVTGGTSITRTIFGDFYANFGVAGIIGGMAVFGVGTGLVRRRFVDRRDIPSLLLYGVAFFTVLNHEADFATILAGLPRLLILVALVGWFITRIHPASQELEAQPIPAPART